MKWLDGKGVTHPGAAGFARRFKNKPKKEKRRLKTRNKGELGSKTNKKSKVKGGKGQTGQKRLHRVPTQDTPEKEGGDAGEKRSG